MTDLRDLTASSTLLTGEIPTAKRPFLKHIRTGVYPYPATFVSRFSAYPRLRNEQTII
ncbi:MAG: hypothetical protein K2H10_02335 [Bacteroidales bacterium]|nr:hypothetical protein [Bacteroidales bacterium]